MKRRHSSAFTNTQFVAPRSIVPRPIFTTRKKSRVVPGYTRRTGFYGRFAGRQAEYKFFDTAHNFQFDLTGEVPATGQLNLIPEGVTESTRVGRKCVIKSIQMKGRFLYSPAMSTVGAGVAYLYLILDKQTNGAPALITDVFTSDNMASNQINLANSQRFRILKKWVVPLNSAAGASAAFSSNVKPFKYYKKCNIPLQFSSTTGAIGEIRSNNLFLMAGTTPADADDLINFTGSTRIRFSDN